jgi:hypothetical protein
MIYRFITRDKNEAKNLLKAQDMFYLILVFHEWLFYEIDENDREEWEPVLDKLNDMLTTHSIDIYDD